MKIKELRVSRWCGPEFRIQQRYTSSKDLEIVIPGYFGGFKVPVKNFIYLCLDAVSHTFDLWKVLSFSPVRCSVNVLSTYDLQLMSSMFHLYYVLSMSPSVDSVLDNVVTDYLPPRNYLFIPSETLQRQIDSPEMGNVLQRDNEVYSCFVMDSTGKKRTFYYRPYSVDSRLFGLFFSGYTDYQKSVYRQVKEDRERLLKFKHLIPRTWGV